MFVVFVSVFVYKPYWKLVLAEVAAGSGRSPGTKSLSITPALGALLPAFVAADVGVHSVVVSLGVCLVTNKVTALKSTFWPRSNSLILRGVTLSASGSPSTPVSATPKLSATVASNILVWRLSRYFLLIGVKCSTRL